MDVVLSVKHLRQLAQSHAVTHWNWAIVREVFMSRLGKRTLDESSSNGIRAIQHDDGYPGLGCCLQKIAEGCFVGVEANSRVLQVNDHGVELLQYIRRRMPCLRRSAVNAINGNPCRGVARVTDSCRIQRSSNPVFGAEDGSQLNS